MTIRNSYLRTTIGGIAAASLLATPAIAQAATPDPATTCPSAATLLTALTNDASSFEAAGAPTSLADLSCALPYATVTTPVGDDIDSSFVLFTYDGTKGWTTLNVASGAVCDELVPADLAAKLNGCEANDSSGDDLPDLPDDDSGYTAAAVTASGVSVVGGRITRTEVMQRAQGWVDNQPGPYTHYAKSWDPTHTRTYRRDCSGYVDMAWHLDSDQSTHNLSQVADPISRSDLKAGDVLNDPGHHVVLFKSWKSDRRHFTYYTFGSTPVKIRTAAVDSGKIDSHPVGEYIPMRYSGKIIEPATPSTPTPPTPPTTSTGSSFSGDAKADLMVLGADGDLSARLNHDTYFDGGTTISKGWSNFLGYNGSGRLYFADFNGDGKTDLIVHGSEGDISVRINKGTYFDGGTTISKGWSNFLGYNGSGKLYFADFNGDGKTDLMVLGAEGDLSARLNHGTYFDGGTTISKGWGNYLGYNGSGLLNFA